LLAALLALRTARRAATDQAQSLPGTT
jgi:hypothetical protein